MTINTNAQANDHEPEHPVGLITNQTFLLEQVFNNFFPGAQNLYFLVGYFYFSGFERLYKERKRGQARIPRFFTQYMELVPIPLSTDVQKAPIVKCVKLILADPTGPEVGRLETEIDRMVYELYQLTPEEIAIVEGKNERY